MSRQRYTTGNKWGHDYEVAFTTEPVTRSLTCAPCKAGYHEGCQGIRLVHGEYGNWIRCPCTQHEPPASHSAKKSPPVAPSTAEG